MYPTASLCFFFFFLMIRPPPDSPLFPYPTLSRSPGRADRHAEGDRRRPTDGELRVQPAGRRDHNARRAEDLRRRVEPGEEPPLEQEIRLQQIGRASCRERV